MGCSDYIDGGFDAVRDRAHAGPVSELASELSAQRTMDPIVGEVR